MRTLEACSDPLKYCTLRPEPDWTVLGKKLGKALNTVSKAIKVRGGGDTDIASPTAVLSPYPHCIVGWPSVSRELCPLAAFPGVMCTRLPPGLPGVVCTHPPPGRPNELTLPPPYFL